jgi:C4-dicarboxylate transporter DctM subunit
MIALYGGFATPSETAGLGAVLALGLIAAIYSVWTPRELEPILVSTLRESTMLMLIIGMSLLYSYVMSYLHISQSTAEWIVSLHLSRWVLLAMILLMVVVLGFFLPPVSIILMTAPIILPPLRAANFDSPSGRFEYFRDQEYCARHTAAGCHVGRYALRRLDDPRLIILCFVPGIATWFPDFVMGVAIGH